MWHKDFGCILEILLISQFSDLLWENTKHMLMWILKYLLALKSLKFCFLSWLLNRQFKKKKKNNRTEVMEIFKNIDTEYFPGYFSCSFYLLHDCPKEPITEEKKKEGIKSCIFILFELMRRKLKKRDKNVHRRGKPWFSSHFGMYHLLIARSSSFDRTKCCI